MLRSFLVLFFVASFVFSSLCVSEIEMDALRALYNSTNGDNWNRRWNWFEGNPCTNSWWGIACDDDANINSIIMPSNNLVGTLPNELGNLPHVWMLAFFNNYLTGTMPSSLSNLKDLNYLQLNFNAITGTIPESYGNWYKLIELSLIGNQLTGTIPNSLGHLESAKYIMMHSNQLTGTIPASFANFTSATRIKVAKNQLKGPLPWTSDPGLDVFDARDNLFSCPLPSWCSSSGNGFCEPCT